MKKFDESSDVLAEVVFEVSVEQDDTPFVGNVSACGDDEEDKRAEDEVRRGLEDGNTWAWAWVRVVAKLTIDGEEFDGVDSLGGVSYPSERAFKESGVYSEMCEAATADLVEQVNLAVRKGRVAKRILDSVDGWTDCVCGCQEDEHHEEEPRRCKNLKCQGLKIGGCEGYEPEVCDPFEDEVHGWTNTNKEEES